MDDRFDRDKRPQIEGLLGDSPAGMAYQFRLINGRIGPDVSGDDAGRG
jgi:hypothetical protein